MSAGGEHGGVNAIESELLRRVADLDRAEREAIDGGRWDEVDDVIGAQKRLWRELMALAEDEATADAAVEPLNALYRVRRRNHALIQHTCTELRRQLAVARAGAQRRSEGRTAYSSGDGRAA
ncbi:MAG: hypothetical protein AB7Y46_01270 [Armatimonadota bacterium]